LSNIELFALGAVLLVGIPHGGLDAVIARKQGWPTSHTAWLAFHLLYIFLSLLVILVWLVLPLLSLTLFLLISAIHFARSDFESSPGRQWIPLIAHGGLVPLAIPYAQALQVQPIFTLLVGEANGFILLDAMQSLFFPWLASVAIYAYYALRNLSLRQSFIILVGLVVAAFILPPLVTFALYFCAFHSPRHVRTTLSKLSTQERHRGLFEMAAYSTLAVLAIIVGAFLFQDEMQFAPKLIQFSFIGMAALTVPHMLLVDYAGNKKMRFI
jgi:Brp/Blh family beta-carotene 15,15'-monooxygenase